MRIYFLGTAGAVASADRDNTSLIVQIHDRLILIDCPGSVVQKIKRLDQKPESITDVIITHDHTDHIYGLPSVIHSLWLAGKKSELNIRATRAVLYTCMKLVDALMLRAKKGMFALNFLPFEDKNVVIDEPDFRLSVFNVKHSEGSVGISMDFRGKKIVYSSDTEPCDSLEIQAFEADFLIHECNNAGVDRQPGHSNPEEVATLAKRTQVKQLYLVHLAHEFIEKPVLAIERVKKLFNGPVNIPSDLDSIEIP
jgi:ribonuclease Z